jgi:hypothetical protein
MLGGYDLVEIQNQSRKDAKIAKELAARENVIVFVQFLCDLCFIARVHLSIANNVI